MKEKRLIQYLKDFGNISSLEAFKELGETRLSATVFELRKKGYNIQDTTEKSLNRYGEPVHFKRYYITKEDLERAERETTL